MKLIKELLKGVMIGIANIIPGVSGGTMAVSMGIYDKLLYAVNNIRKQFKKSVLYLLPYMIGMVVGIGALSIVIEYFFREFPLETSLGFIGLIVGGVPILIKKVKGAKFKTSYAISFLFFFSLIIFLQLLNGREGAAVVLSSSPSMIVKLFLIGILASATMVIPGVSGSMILMLLGFYQPVIDCISNCMKALKTLDFAVILENGIILLPFALGIVLGIVVIAKMMTFLFEKYTHVTFYGILGLVLASPIAILMSTDLGKTSFSNIIGGSITLLIGGTISYLLGKDEA